MLNNTKQASKEEVSADNDKNGDATNAVDPIYLKALRLVVMNGDASKAFLQAKLGIGYPKASRIVDWMEEMGFISKLIDNKTRTIYITREEYERRYGPFDENI